MDDLEFKSSETAYYTKKELSQYLNISVIDQVWKDIEAYRSYFKVHDVCMRENEYIVLNSYVSKKMMILLEKMLMLPQESGQSDQLYEFIKDQIKENKEAFLCIDFLKECQMKSLGFATCQEHLKLFFFEEKDCNAYLLRSCPFMIRLNALLSNEEFSFIQKVVLSACILKQANCEKFIPYLEPSCFIKEYSKEEDQTYNLLALIKIFNQALNKKLIRENESSLQHQGVESLIYRYPMLPKAAVSFYSKHNQPGHYYTISQYIEENQVCYETGRQAMEQLVQHRFYQKTKVGKKFVYSIF